jgi:hypothetical protein
MEQQGEATGATGLSRTGEALATDSRNRTEQEQQNSRTGAADSRTTEQQEQNSNGRNRTAAGSSRTEQQQEQDGKINIKFIIFRFSSVISCRF